MKENAIFVRVKQFLTPSSRSAPAFFLLAALLAFGLLLPWLGFYWDDWAKILVSRLWGLGAYPAYYAEDRPLSSWTHIALTPILGEGPFGWQVANLLLRWLSAWGMWWALNRLWPANRRQNLLAALLFLVYPVFQQQPAGVTFHQQWLQYALFFVSLGAMIAAWQGQGPGARRAFWGWTALGIGAQLLQLSVTEYFTAVDLVRPAALWILFGAAGGGLPARLARVLRAWAPYLVSLAAYTVWRLFFPPISGADPYRAETLYRFLEDPVATLRDAALVALADELRILVTSWADLLYIQVTQAAPFTLLSYAVGLLAGGLAGVYLYHFCDRFRGGGDSPAGETDPSWAAQAALLGLAAVLLGPIPAWITGRQVVFDFHSDRYAMPAMFGAGLLCAAGIEWLARRRLQAAVLAGLLVGLATGLHLRTANDYRWIWADQQRFFWQLAWRAPGIDGPAAIFLENEPFPNQGLFSTSAALNLMYPQPEGYGQQAGQGQLGYWVYTLRPRYQQPPESLEIGLRTTFRTLTFQGATPASLLVYKNPSRGNCLWLLSPRDANHPDLPELVRAFLPISNLGLIRAEGAPGYPPADLIGPEPPRGWCYYYQKAELARQFVDWQTAAALADQALADGYRPDTPGSNAPYEWLPFIDGLAGAGRWEEAAALTGEVYTRDPRYAGMLCALWDARPDAPEAALEAVSDLFDCP